MLKNILFLLTTIACFSPLLAADYVVLIHSGVNIRTAPDTSSVIIGEASKGQLYQYAGETDGWFKVRMFNGDERYISKPLSAALQKSEILPGHNLNLTAPHEIVQAMRLKILRAREDAAGFSAPAASLTERSSLPVPARMPRGRNA
jgi:SH3-like domain-containing protein